MKIHREGYNSIAVMTLFVALVVMLLNVFYPQQTLRHYVLYGLLVVLAVMIVQFFRSPNRNIVRDDAHVLCPADGEIVVVEEVQEQEYFHKRMKLVSIFMSPLNVHLNRYPVSGKVNYMKYHPGKFLVAWHPKSSELNERNSIALETPQGDQLLIRQVAGAVARRIVCYSQQDMQVSQGEELGFIKFGSRVDLYLPLDAEVQIRVGEKVKGGETVIARFSEL
ncbi:MAG: phosphatidylserine decarboxylase family protein [Bacteroidales bacterium]